MNKAFLPAITCLWLAANIAHASQCPEVTADTTRIVVSGGSLTEIIYRLGAEANIVGVDRTSNFPPAALELPQIGYVRALSAEGVLSQEPTLLLGEDDTGPPEVVDQLRAAGLAIAIVGEQHDADGIIAKVRCVGKLIGREAAAEALIRDTLTPASDSLAGHTGDATRKKGVVLLGIRDGTLIAAGEETSGAGLLTMMDTDNALSAMSGWKPVSMEAMLAADPAFLIVPERGVKDAGGVDKLLEHPALRLTRAAKEKRVYAMDGMAMLGFGPRTLEAAARLGDAVRAAETDTAAE